MDQAAARELNTDAFIIDAELISSGNFNDIPAGIKRQEVSAIAFDLLHLDGADLRREPLEDLKETLANRLADASDCIQHSDVFTDSAKLLEVAVEYGLKSIVSKRLGSAHSSNRCLSCLKIKTARESCECRSR